MATFPAKDANGTAIDIEYPLSPGRKAATLSRPVVLSNEDAAYLDGIEGLLGTIDGRVDGLETLIGATNTKLDTLLASIKAEDAAHASGDTGRMALAVRKDTAAALAGTDGDYAPLEVDALGRLHVALEAAIKAASTTAVDGDKSLVVQLHPRSTNANGRTSAAASAPVVTAYEEYETVAAGQTDQVMGATGAVGDVLAYLLVIPATTSPGAVSIKDGNGSSIPVFDGGTLASLIPFAIPLNIRAANATSAGWKITTGSNVRVIAFGDFT